MDPVTLALLLGTGTTAARQLPALLPSSYEAKQKSDLKNLLQKQSAGELGLTDEERRLMESRLMSGVAGASQQAANERARFLAGSGAQVGGGQALLQAQLADEQKTRALAEANAKIEEANLQKKMQQEEQIGALQGLQAERRAQRLGAFGNIIGAGVEAYTSNAPLDKMMSTVKALPPEQQQAFNQALISDLANKQGWSPERTQQVVDTFSQNPELAQYYLMTSRGGK